MFRKLHELRLGLAALLVAALVSVSSLAPFALGQVVPGEGGGDECPPQGQSWTCSPTGAPPRCCGRTECITEQCEGGQCTCISYETTYYYVDWQ